MLPTDQATYSGPRYAVIAWALGQTLLFYEEYGDYQGEWLMLSRDRKNYYIWKGWYGSCSGCDAFEAELGTNPTMAEARKFAEGYHPFLEVPVSTMRNVVRRKKLAEILPGNIRSSEWSDVDLPEAVRDMSMAVRLDLGMDIEPADIIQVANQDIQGRAMQQVGYDVLMSALSSEVLEETEQGVLLRIDGFRPYLVAVTDPSTGKRYLLRVPPDTMTVKAALAWTFGMSAGQYNPLVET